MKHSPTRFGDRFNPYGQSAPFALSPVFLLVMLATTPVVARAATQDSNAEPEPKRNDTPDASTSDALAFDADALRARGIDPALAAYFSQTAKFSPGEQRVTLTVNDEPKGLVSARFDSSGRLCFDRAFLERAGLVVPLALQEEKTADGAASGPASPCYDYRDAYSQTEVDLDPGQYEVRLVVPTASLQNSGTGTSGHYTSGGVGGVFNYNLIGMQNQGGGSNSRYLYADGEVGFNAGDWIVRSRHSYTSQDNRGSVDNLYTYAQKTFVQTGSMLQLGQINATGSLFPIPAITGAQYFPDQALIPQAGGPSFNGIADSQSRIEVRQLGSLIYSTVVPAGPYALANLQLVSAAADVEITQVGQDAATRRYTVPVASLTAGQRVPQGLSVAVGKIRDISDAGIRTPFLATASKGWNVGKYNRVAAGGMVAQGYQAVAASVDTVFSNNVATNLQSIMSNAQREGVRGAMLSAGLNVRVTDTLSASFSATQQSRGYRTISDTTDQVDDIDGYARVRSQYTASVSWQHRIVGGLTASYSKGTYYNGPGTQYMSLGWNRKIGTSTLSVNLEKDLASGNRNSSGTGNTGYGKLRFYAMLSVPLGRASLLGYSTNVGGQTRFGAGVQQTVNDYVSYTARAETNPSGGGPNASGTLTVTPRYTQASMSYARTGRDNASFTAQLQGGVAATREGVAFTPYSIGDTFGMVTMGNLSGVRITTPQGPVWTSFGGHAVVPVLPAYQKSRIEVVTKTLPRNADLDNGIEYVNAGRGSVNSVKFGVVKVRRVLLDVTMPDGSPLPRALAVVDDKGQYVTTSVGGGHVFLDNDTQAALDVKLSDDRRCRLDYSVPTKPNLDRPFDVVQAVCRG